MNQKSFIFSKSSLSNTVIVLSLGLKWNSIHDIDTESIPCTTYAVWSCRTDKPVNYKERKNLPQNEQIVVKNSHPYIIFGEDFEAV